MSHLFPTLDSLRPSLPKAEPSTDWVALLGASPPPPTRPTGGWAPPGLESAAMVDLDALRAEAQEGGFCAGYLQGQRAGTERGHAEGRRVGLAEGREEGRQEVLAAQAAALAEFRAALGSAVETVGPAAERWQAELESRVTTMAMDAVRALLAAELNIEAPDAMGIVREALGFAEGAVRATVRLSPFDRAALAERKEEILQACAGLREVELVDDRSIAGGCVVETEQGVVDATLETRLALLEAA